MRDHAIWNLLGSRYDAEGWAPDLPIGNRPSPYSVSNRCGSPEIVEGSLCRFSGEGGVLVVVR